VKKPRVAKDTLRFYAELQEQTSVAACSDLFRETVGRFGIRAFACGEIDLADRDRSVMFVAECAGTKQSVGSRPRHAANSGEMLVGRRWNGDSPSPQGGASAARPRLRRPYPSRCQTPPQRWIEETQRKLDRSSN
jgi:hypothetical protein